jgi:hypothetical protein
MNGIGNVLKREWDPIPDSADDEYEAYAHQIASLLRRGASDEELFSYLARTETVDIGLGEPADADRIYRVSTALRAIRPCNEKGPGSDPGAFLLASLRQPISGARP